MLLFIWIDFNNRHMMADSGQHCKVTVDGMDFCIKEPSLFNLKWYSHKLKVPALCYANGMCIKARLIVWVNGPFPAGDWSDLKIVRSGFNHHLQNH